MGKVLKKFALNLSKKLGKATLPIALAVFAIVLFGLMYSNVRLQNVTIHVGQLAEETIRANKTVENTKETEQRKRLAEEAVTPEYVFQADVEEIQKTRITDLFSWVNQINETYEKQKKKSETTTPVEGKVALLKGQFEKLSQEDVTFYQKFSTTFYENLFSLNTTQLSMVKSEDLTIMNTIMKEHVRENNLIELRQKAVEETTYLDLTPAETQIMKELLTNGIVVNDVYNEKRTNLLRQQAADDVQKVMIYQGEVIVREGVQIDQNAMNKLELLGMTSQNKTIFPTIALILAIVLQIVILLFFFVQTTDKDRKYRLLTFYISAMTLSVLLMKFLQIFQTEELSYVPFLFPAAFTPLILSQFVNRRAGIIAAMFQVIFSMFIFNDAMGNLLAIILLNYLFDGFFGTALKQKRINQQLLPAFCWLLGFPVLFNFVLVIYQGMDFSDQKTWMTLLCGFIGSLLTFVMSMGLHPYIEMLVSDDSVIVLNELSNPNHPLLKELLEKAPGTYHHSMMVANLSANAVADIGGRSLLTRVACYYHDIGKIKHANFFVENLPAGAENPHNFLLPEDSKQIIFGHVIDGAKILEEYHMPQMVIDICWQHHGTTLMRYFFVKAQERNSEISEADYRYPGPKPQTKEAGIVSLADTCEAAVRAMDAPSQAKIEKFVHELIQNRLIDGQLDESGLTMGEIRTIEKSLISGLASTFHSRIKYPKMKSEAEKMKEENDKGGN